MTAKQEIVATIVAVSAYYGQQLPDVVIEMYAEDLIDLPLESLREAFKAIRRDPKITRFPLPAQIRDRIQPADVDELNAAEAAARIPEAIQRFGWPNPELAREFIGELGWRVVQRDGGWRNVCQLLTHDNVGVLKAQWKNSALVQLRRGKLGLVDYAPVLPDGQSRASGGLVSLQDSIRSITESREKP